MNIHTLVQRSFLPERTSELLISMGVGWHFRDDGGLFSFLSLIVVKILFF